MNIGILIAVFLLGIVVGAVGIMGISCLVVDSMNHKRELTKEEWKMGIHPDHMHGGGFIVLIYMGAAVVIFGTLLFVISNR